MKKLVYFFLLGVNIFALDLNVGFSISEAYKRDNHIKSYQQEVYGIDLELTHKFSVTEVGVGAAYEGDYKYKGEEFQAIPIYGLVKFNLAKKKSSPYVVGKFGEIVFLTDNIKGKEFISVGVGMKVRDKFEIEFSHDVSHVNESKDCFGKNSLIIRYNVM